MFHTILSHHFTASLYPACVAVQSDAGLQCSLQTVQLPANHLMLAQQAKNLKRHLSKCHGKNLDPRYNGHLCSKLQYNYITLNSSKTHMHINYLHTIQQGWRNPCCEPDVYSVNIYGKIRARLQANRQNNHLMLAKQARNLKRHQSKCQYIWQDSGQMAGQPAKQPFDAGTRSEEP